MTQLWLQFKHSWQELKHVKTLVVAAMMVAIAVVLGYFTVQIGESIKIGFSFLANELSAMMFGPVVGSMVAGIADIIKYLLKPTGPFFPGFTISAMLGGVIYGIFLYGKPISLKRIVLAKCIVAVFVNMLLNTYWISMLYGSPFVALLPARLLKQILMLPIEIVLFYLVATVLSKTGMLAESRVKLTS